MADIAAGEKRNKSVPISLVLSPELKNTSNTKRMGLMKIYLKILRYIRLQM